MAKLFLIYNTCSLKLKTITYKKIKMTLPVINSVLLIEHVNHLLNKSIPSGFAFSGVLVCCVSSVAMKVVN